MVILKSNCSKFRNKTNQYANETVPREGCIFGWPQFPTFSHISCIFVHHDLDSVPYLVGMYETTIVSMLKHYWSVYEEVHQPLLWINIVIGQLSSTCKWPTCSNTSGIMLNLLPFLKMLTANNEPRYNKFQFMKHFPFQLLSM